MLPQTAKWLNCRKKETIKTDAEAQCGISHLPWPGPSLPTSVPFAQLSFLMVLFPPKILSVLGCLNLLLNQNQNPLNCLLKNKNKTYLCCESVPWLSHQTVKNKPGLFGIYLHMRFPLIPNSTTEEWMRWSQRSRNPGIHNMMPRARIFFFSNSPGWWKDQGNSSQGPLRGWKPQDKHLKMLSADRKLQAALTKLS